MKDFGLLGRLLLAFEAARETFANCDIVLREEEGQVIFPDIAGGYFFYLGPKDADPRDATQWVKFSFDGKVHVDPWLVRVVKRVNA